MASTIAMEFWKVTQPLTEANGASKEGQNLGSKHDAIVNWPSMDKTETRHLPGDGNCPSFIDGLARELTVHLWGKSSKQIPKCASKSPKKSGLFRPRYPRVGLKNCLNFCLRSIRCAGPPLSKSQKDSVFFGTRVPAVSLKNYVKLCLSSFNCSGECYVLALVYINRIAKIAPNMICSLSIHRLLFFALLLAAKYHDDDYYSNRCYAKIGGLTVERMNMLEIEFVKMLDWKVFVDAQEYQFHLGLILQASELEGPSPTIPLDEPEAEP